MTSRVETHHTAGAERVESVAKKAPTEAVADLTEASRVDQAVSAHVAAPKPVAAFDGGQDDRAAARDVSLSLSEATVSEMEKRSEDLRRFASATRTGEGWRIRILPEDEVFVKAGIQNGDLITFERLDEQLARPESAAITNRFVSVLQSIERR